MKYTIPQIAEAINASIVGAYSTETISNIFIDSRSGFFNHESLFFALVGSTNNGHEYITDLLEKGVVGFVVSEKEYIQEKGVYFLVEDTTRALQQLAQFHRSQHQLPIIGITGSNGKTTVKEWLAISLKQKGAVVKTIGSFNSQVGVPLSMFQLNELHNLGVFEAGISQDGEMKNLEEIISPTVGILTNIGAAHDAGFESREQKIKEKLQFFSNCEVVICRDEDAAYFSDKSTLFTWGVTKKTSLNYSVQNDLLKLSYEGLDSEYQVPFSDHVSIENLLHVLAFHVLKNKTIDGLQTVIDQIQPISMRLEVKNGIHDSLLIDDTYNNDPEGMKRALEFLSQQDKRLQRVAIISGFVDSHGSEEYQMLSDELKQAQVEKVILIGQEICSRKTLIKIPYEEYLTTEDFLKDVDTKAFEEKVVLVKGARIYAFEKIVELLQKEFHETVLEVNLSALQHNLSYFRSKIDSKTKVMAMVKAYAYGAGATTVARLMEYNRVDYLGVAYVDEGVELRSKGIETPIMVMNPTDKSIHKFIEYDLEPEVYCFDQLKKLIISLNGKSLKIHLKVDTGMHRLGFDESGLSELISILEGNRQLEIASVFTHLAAADVAGEDSFTSKQIEIYTRFTEDLKKKLKISPIRHVLNSAGIQRFVTSQFDMVRLGIGLYGVGVNESEQSQLKHIGVLKTRVSQIKEVPKNETIGYSRKGALYYDARIATIAIGYADGYDRRFSNGVGRVIVNGEIAKVVGNVCMDMTMIDVTGIEVKEGDEVILFSHDLTVKKLAQSIGTIPYEILTNISERVKRVFVRQ